MRISIPNRLGTKPVIIFIAVIFVGQILARTDFLFALLTAAYIALWASAFNIAGGLEYPSGAYIFSSGLLSVVVGFGAKVVLFQPGERNLQSPIKLMFLYCVSMTMTLLVAFIVRGLRPTRPLLSGFDSLPQMKQSAIACLMIGFVIQAAVTRAQTESGSVLSALAQINVFPLMSILLGTVYEIQHSNGKRSVNWIVASGISSYVLIGLFFFGKEGMMIGFLAWGVAASLHGYSFGKFQLAALALGSLFFFYYLAPYSQYVRNFRSESGSLSENIPIAFQYLSDLPETRRLYLATLDETELNDEAHLYDEREGFLDRLIQVPADDNLIHYTDEGHVFGLAPIYISYVNVIPHFLWPGKPTLDAGNAYAHELGIVADDDTTTGIAFSATAESYHEATWLGLMILMPIQLFLLFIVYDSITGSTRYSAFAMFPIIQMFKFGGSGGITLTANFITVQLFGILLAAWITKTVMPFVLNMVMSSSQTSGSATRSERIPLRRIDIVRRVPSPGSGAPNG